MIASDCLGLHHDCTMIDDCPLIASDDTLMASLIISQADRNADRAAQQKQLAKANAQLESIARQLAERDEQLASTQSSLEDARAALATESERAKKLG
jgi:GAF domain-containing protein